MTKDEIFAAMEKAYTGAGSTVEGSFAGDLLRACADGCAELWSTEIDGLEERAFVASAAGEWLTRVCADRGVERRAGEDDETLRSRALESLKRQGASGNADDYAAWCGTVEGLLRVRVLPLARGAGTVDIVAVGQDGRAASAAAVAAAQSVVDEKRPIGADAKVFAAVEKPLNIAASVVLSEGASLEGVVNAFKGAFTAFCREGSMRGCSSVRRTRRGFPAGSASTALPTGRERTARAAGRASMPRWRAGRRSPASGSQRWRSRSAARTAAR